MASTRPPPLPFPASTTNMWVELAAARPGAITDADDPGPSTVPAGTATWVAGDATAPSPSLSLPAPAAHASGGADAASADAAASASASATAAVAAPPRGAAGRAAGATGIAAFRRALGPPAAMSRPGRMPRRLMARRRCLRCYKTSGPAAPDGRARKGGGGGKARGEGAASACCALPVACSCPMPLPYRRPPRGMAAAARKRCRPARLAARPCAAGRLRRSGLAPGAPRCAGGWRGFRRHGAPRRVLHCGRIPPSLHLDAPAGRAAGGGGKGGRDAAAAGRLAPRPPCAPPPCGRHWVPPRHRPAIAPPTIK